MRVRAIWSGRKASFLYPISPEPRTAVLLPSFRSSGNIRVFPQGWCEVIATLPGQADIISWVWLSHHRDLRVENTWLLVDDFSGPVLSANVGAWGAFDNAHAGGTAKVGPLVPSGPASERVLNWDFDLGTGGYQYCGLEWSQAGWPGLAFVDKVRYRAKAAQPTVIDFHLVQSDIGDDNYFGVLDTLGTT